MAVLLENTTNCVWLAFAALHQESPGFVNKSKLKVLTANIGSLLDLYGVEKGLEHFRSTATLNFNQFKYYLQNEVFASIPNKAPPSELQRYENKIAEICWLVCRKKYLCRKNGIFDDDGVFKIFRIFCVLAELVADTNNENFYQVLLHPSEVFQVAQTLANSLGCKFDDDDFTSLSVSMGSFRLTPFIAVLESRCLNGVQDNIAVHEGITDLYQTIVEDVIKKGFMTKKGYIFPTMREYWFVLTPTELTYYKTRQEKEKSGVLHIEPNSTLAAKAGFKITLQTSDRIYELGTSDHMTRLQWISSLKTAVEHSGNPLSYQRSLASKRRLQRQGRIQEMIRARAQLQQERTARVAAEGQAKELEAVVKADTMKLTELEQVKIKLEKLLEEETQAKRDEEIVRNLQARVLAEEWEKREELERLQEEQKQLLNEERSKRKEYEELQLYKEKELLSAKTRLTQLELERQALDEQLKLAKEKAKKSEDKKELLEAKLLQVGPQLREKNDGVRRAHSFIPSTKEKPIVLDIRSTTLRKKEK